MAKFKVKRIRIGANSKKKPEDKSQKKAEKKPIKKTDNKEEKKIGKKPITKDEEKPVKKPVIKEEKKTEDTHQKRVSKIDELIKNKKEPSEKKTGFFHSDKKDKTAPEPKKPNEIEIKKEIPKSMPPHKKENFDIYSEKLGFGWKGMGSRRIIFDKIKKDYLYEVIEPNLKPDEEDTKNKLVHLFRVNADVDVFDMDDQEKLKYLYKSLQKIIEDNRIVLDDFSRDRIFYYIFREFTGYGRIDIMMKDEVIEDISCDGQGVPIFIYHRELENIKSNVVFMDSDELDSFAIKLSQICGKQISIYEPVVDGKLADGSRLQTTLAKTITKSSTFTIRRFREDPMTPIDLIANNTLSVDMAAYFWLAIDYGASVLFCGGTASGKTTMLNALSMFLPSTYKIVSVEDTREINLPHENWIAGTTRTGFSQSEQSKSGKDIDMFDLIRVALRQRPRAIIVGEVRGKEAYSLFQAMTTGHLSYSTVHASDMHSLVQRLESPPINLPRSLLTSLDLVIFMNNRTVKGQPVRRVTNVTEIIKLDPETNRLVTLSPYYWVSELDDKFEKPGGSKLMQRLQISYGWSDQKLDQEVKNRIKVLEWMMKRKKRTYVEVGKIISDYDKDPKSVLEIVEGKK